VSFGDNARLRPSIAWAKTGSLADSARNEKAGGRPRRGAHLRLPTVSVVIATWNRPRLVRRLVSQLREQTTCPNAFEIVVVDDGSEPPLALPGPSPGPGPKVMLVRQENAGPASARHRGILEAEGALILLLDDDMSVAPDFLAAHLRQHAAEGRRVVLGQIRPDPDLARMPLFERFHAAMLDRFVADVDSGRITVSGTHVCTGNVSFPRADYLAVGGFDSSFDRSEDAELGIRLQKAGLTLVLSKEAASTHRSDHTRLGVWMKRAYRYGINDLRGSLSPEPQSSTACGTSRVSARRWALPETPWQTYGPTWPPEAAVGPWPNEPAEALDGGGQHMIWAHGGSAAGQSSPQATVRRSTPRLLRAFADCLQRRPHVGEAPGPLTLTYAESHPSALSGSSVRR
jgi:GT2 family glycosyltransferase